jgi:hypothetical protein
MEGKLAINRTMEGTWQILGDSLFRDYDTDVMALDKSKIKFATEQTETVENFIAEYEDYIAKHNEKAKQEGPEMGHRSNAVFIDHSGSKIELSKTAINAEGEDNTTTTYMVKKNN